MNYSGHERGMTRKTKMVGHQFPLIYGTGVLTTTLDAILSGKR